MDKYAIVIAGPSGAGKTTIADRLIEKLGTLEMSCSATTRAKRGDGRDDEYVYLTVEEFKQSIENGDVLEYTEYSENFYGTRKSELQRIWDMDKNPILVLDYNGVRSLKDRLDIPVFAFYVYTSLDEAKRRLIERDLKIDASAKKTEVLLKRLKANICDYDVLHTMAGIFDGYVENSEVETCVEKIESALELLTRGEEVMKDFEKEEITKKFKKESADFAEKATVL